jgi:hypothetical protein
VQWFWLKAESETLADICERGAAWFSEHTFVDEWRCWPGVEPSTWSELTRLNKSLDGALGFQSVVSDERLEDTAAEDWFNETLLESEGCVEV